MPGLFKKALSVFVEFDDESVKESSSIPKKQSPQSSTKADTGKNSLNPEEIEKFEKHFDQLMNGANLPGPDYFEFCKMMEALETHVPDEKARYAAVFASLSAQGLSKDKLINSAAKYKVVIQEDKAKFEVAVNDKLKNDVENRKSQLTEVEKKIAENNNLIKKLQQEIADAQAKIQALNSEIGENEQKIKSNSEGYILACNAMLNKINVDIQKIETLI